MKKNKLFYVLPLLIGAILISQFAFTKLNNFTSLNRAGDVVGPGVTTKKDCSNSCHTGVTAVVNNTVNRIFTFGTGQTAYIPGTVHNVKFKIKGAAPVGFTATVLRNDSNIMAGTLTPSDTSETKVFLHAASGRYYINHRLGDPVGGEKEYNFTWTAPAKGKGAVTFYFASLTSNNDQSWDFDTTYQNTYVITEGTPIGISENSAANSFNVFPNPVTDKVNVSFTNKTAGVTTVNLYSLDGKQSISLLNENLTAGEHTFNFDLSENVKSGIYFIRISNASMNSVKKILVY